MTRHKTEWRIIMNLSDEMLKGLLNGYDHTMAAFSRLFVRLQMSGVEISQRLTETAITK